MQTKLTLVSLAAVGLIGVTGCISTNDRTTGRVMDDYKVSSRVKSALNHDPVYKYEDVDVKTYNGIVQLNGWATTSDQVERAAGIAERVEGVGGVINQISIKRSPTGRGEGYPYKPTEDPGYRTGTNNTTRPYRPADVTPSEPLPPPPPPNTPDRTDPDR